MLDGKFSVYNNNQGNQPPPADIKKPSPINFKYESVTTAALSFDDELRLAMHKFHKAKQPSPSKEAIKKWVSDGSAFLLSTPMFKGLKEKAEAEPEPKPFKNPAAPYIKLINEKKESVKTSIKKMIPEAPKEVKPFENPLKPQIAAFKQALKEFAEKIVLLIPDINIPDVKIPELKIPNIKIPEIKFNFPKLEFPAKFMAQIEKTSSRIEKPILDFFARAQERYEKLIKQLEEWTDELYEQIPFEKMAEMMAFIQEIPQYTIIPLALWIQSFIPVNQIKYAFDSGVKRIINVANHLGNFANRSYKFVEKGVVKVIKYLMNQLIIPFSKWLESFLRMFALWLIKVTTIIAKSLYQFFLKIPRFVVRAVKAIGQATLWIASKFS